MGINKNVPKYTLRTMNVFQSALMSYIFVFSRLVKDNAHVLQNDYFDIRCSFGNSRTPKGSRAFFLACQIM